MPDLKRIGERIRIKREELGLTQEQFAEQADLNSKYISVVENGNKCMQIDTLMKICDVLDIEYHFFLTGNETINKRNELMYKLSKLTEKQYVAVASVIDAMFTDD